LYSKGEITLWANQYIEFLMNVKVDQAAFIKKRLNAATVKAAPVIGEAIPPHGLKSGQMKENLIPR
jgi:hypothetical protein